MLQPHSSMHVYNYLYSSLCNFHVSLHSHSSHIVLTYGSNLKRYTRFFFISPHPQNARDAGFPPPRKSWSVIQPSNHIHETAHFLTNHKLAAVYCGLLMPQYLNELGPCGDPGWPYKGCWYLLCRWCSHHKHFVLFLSKGRMTAQSIYMSLCIETIPVICNTSIKDNMFTNVEFDTYTYYSHTIVFSQTNTCGMPIWVWGSIHRTLWKLSKWI